MEIEGASDRWIASDEESSDFLEEMVGKCTPSVCLFVSSPLHTCTATFMLSGYYLEELYVWTEMSESDGPDTEQTLTASSLIQSQCNV